MQTSANQKVITQIKCFMKKRYKKKKSANLHQSSDLSQMIRTESNGSN